MSCLKEETQKQTFIPCVKEGQRATPGVRRSREGLIRKGEWEMAVDLDTRLDFPRNICETTLRPDIVLCSSVQKTVLVIELTIPWEENIQAAYERKELKYQELVQLQCVENGWRSLLYPISLEHPLRLCRDLSIGQKQLAEECTAAGDHGPSLTSFVEADLAAMFPGVEISNITERAREQAENLTFNLVAAVVQNLRDRFPETELVTAFGIIDPKNMPRDQAALGQYGREELNTLLATYGGVPADQPLTVDPEQTRQEWAIVRQLMYQRRRQSVALTTDSLWEELERVHDRELFPNMLKLATVGRLLPMHTADCERGFSTQNRIKTRLRNSLSVKRLDILMRISINGPYSQASVQGIPCGLQTSQVQWTVLTVELVDEDRFFNPVTSPETSDHHDIGTINPSRYQLMPPINLAQILLKGFHYNIGDGFGICFLAFRIRNIDGTGLFLNLRVRQVGRLFKHGVMNMTAAVCRRRDTGDSERVWTMDVPPPFHGPVSAFRFRDVETADVGTADSAGKFFLRLKRNFMVVSPTAGKNSQQVRSSRPTAQRESPTSSAGEKGRLKRTCRRIDSGRSGFTY
ncbi:hypothetical protein Bbelb_317620 [Branchiostoma belcheri]|nr:hypothetical protein Bbelb_317620 [Branchiostoma belcheri]